MFKNPFSFDGRIRRTEYGLSVIICWAYMLIVAMMINSMRTDPETATMLMLFALIPAYWFMFAQGSKRCHDRGNSGFFQLIPFYGFWMLFADSDFGMNQYGSNPKGLGNVDEVDQIGNYLPVDQH